MINVYIRYTLGTSMICLGMGKLEKSRPGLPTVKKSPSYQCYQLYFSEDRFVPLDMLWIVMVPIVPKKDRILPTFQEKIVRNEI